MKKWRTHEALNPKISVVIAVYNKPEVLKLCLEGYRRQSFFIKDGENFEIILADDGSTPEIEKLFAEFARSVPLPCTYLFQADSGWGKIRMLNWSIVEAHSDFLIFTDSDCVPHPHFVRAHYESQEEKTALCGRRVDLMETVSEKLTLEDIRNGKLESPFWVLRNGWSRKIDYGDQGLYFPSWLVKISESFYHPPTVLGSNFSIHKKWLWEVNGFDESFKEPGLGEDTDIERRFLLNGLKLKWITHRAIQFHVWHPLTCVGERSRKTYELHKEKGNKEAVLGLQELKKFLNQK